MSLLTDRPDLKEWEGMEEKKPRTIDDLAGKVDGLAKTIDDLAVLMQTGFEAVRGEIQAVDKKVDAVDKKVDTVDKKADSIKVLLEARMDRQFDELRERTFDPDQKEGIVAVIDAYNQGLEDAALGKENITLTRPEYDATALATGFPNRFTAKAVAE